MTDYNSDLERHTNTKSSVDAGAEHGVSEADKQANSGWSHRSQMAREGQIGFDEQKPGSRRVNERREGEVVRLAKKDHGKCGSDASNENDDALVDEGKSVKEKYADKYGNEDS